MSEFAKVFLRGGVVCALILMVLPPAMGSQIPAKGNLLGFLFDEDGSTPVAGALVLVKNVTTGAVHESTASDALGIFRIQNLSAGIYALGVAMDQGNFNSQDFFGVSPGETAKVTITLDPYETAAAAAAAAVAKEQKDKSEAFIGRVSRYLPEARDVEIDVDVGLLQSEDRLHIKGDMTDFYMDVRYLRVFGKKAKRAMSGQTARLASSKACAPGDFVYVVCRKGIPPFFLAPLGVAAIVAGSVPLSAIYTEEPVSQFKVKK